eukprot:Phypoly_transcript_06905.p2 GENE.Phypoly_transcript_06905~~Phypoly_transcript_06905.p2  ORF type:complete len:217 (+),score=16.11 Phypoly_transcript_06905:890-1540(+)
MEHVQYQALALVFQAFMDHVACQLAMTSPRATETACARPMELAFVPPILMAPIATCALPTNMGKIAPNFVIPKSHVTIKDPALQTPHVSATAFIKGSTAMNALLIFMDQAVLSFVTLRFVLVKARATIQRGYAFVLAISLETDVRNAYLITILSIVNCIAITLRRVTEEEFAIHLGNATATTPLYSTILFAPFALFQICMVPTAKHFVTPIQHVAD